MEIKAFQRTIWDHYRRHGRRMPWRATRDPYRILVSEIMLQQTQVSRVMRFYPEFIKRFHNFGSLARAKRASVLRAWQGLGYNRRAAALQELSRKVLKEFNGKLPNDRAALESLPGIGKATAGSLRAFIWSEPEIFIETNIRRVFIHFFFRSGSAARRSMKVTDIAIQRYIESSLPKRSVREWYWALMDYGAMLGEANRGANPNQRSAHYRKQARFKGSTREARGAILRSLLRKKKMPAATWAGSTAGQSAIAALMKEGFVKKIGNSLVIA